MSWRRRVLLAAVSGSSVWPLSYVLDWLDAAGLSGNWRVYALHGATFGALVLVPFLAAKRERVGSVIALVLGSVVIYGLVVELAVEGYGPLNLEYDSSIVVSGLLGALLVGALTKFVVPLQASGWFWVAVSVAGLLGGLLFSVVWESSYDALAFLGYVGWQVAVCVALLKGTISNNVLERTRDG